MQNSWSHGCAQIGENGSPFISGISWSSRKVSGDRGGVQQLFQRPWSEFIRDHRTEYLAPRSFSLFVAKKNFAKQNFALEIRTNTPDSKFMKHLQLECGNER